MDCLPDAVVVWRAAEPNPAQRFGAQNLPGIVSGPPGDSAPTAGSTSVASLGDRGTMTYALTDIVIEDRPGPDFIVFENAFFVGSVPTSPADDYVIFDEPGTVEVSADGTSWIMFPYDPQALADAHGRNIDRALHLRLRGLAGITPTFTGNWTVPDDPEVWDPNGTGGVSGAGGDAFDLATVGLAEARFVRITDAGAQNGFPGAAEGFDLDALVVLHGRPVAPATADTDGDLLPDLAETRLFGTDPASPDSDGDGTDDGREVAGCRDPLSASDRPWWLARPRLWLRGTDCTEARWTFLGGGRTADLFRGDLAALVAGPEGIDLGPGVCLADDTAAVRYACDTDRPAPGSAFDYLVREGAGDYGRGSALEPRSAASGCP
ncbi:MAG: hypothetical protein D6718_13830 [Acidobacteria bacterium]|nr:MAG: hypothetical protein D6718_13830 [Acidobacteriota bacterium]